MQRDARLSPAELARLEGSGTITGYHAGVDPRALGLTLSAIIRVRGAPGQISNVAQLARDIEEVIDRFTARPDDDLDHAVIARGGAPGRAQLTVSVPSMPASLWLPTGQ